MGRLGRRADVCLSPAFGRQLVETGAAEGQLQSIHPAAACRDSCNLERGRKKEAPYGMLHVVTMCDEERRKKDKRGWKQQQQPREPHRRTQMQRGRSGSCWGEAAWWSQRSLPWDPEHMDGTVSHTWCQFRQNGAKESSGLCVDHENKIQAEQNYLYSCTSQYLPFGRATWLITPWVKFIRRLLFNCSRPFNTQHWRCVKDTTTRGRQSDIFPIL